jgi:hypothetical protein
MTAAVPAHSRTAAEDAIGLNEPITMAHRKKPWVGLELSRIGWNNSKLKLLHPAHESSIRPHIHGPEAERFRLDPLRNSQGENRMRTFLPLLALAAGLTLAVPAMAADEDDAIIITIKDHKFSPAEVKVPDNKLLIVTVVNDDPTPEEF